VSLSKANDKEQALRGNFCLQYCTFFCFRQTSWL